LFSNIQSDINTHSQTNFLIMFTGIVETTGIVKEITIEGTNKTFTIQVPFAHEMKANDSLSHNGVCLTVTKVDGDTYKVTAVQETLLKSTEMVHQILTFD